MKEIATIYSYVKNDINELEALLKNNNASAINLDSIKEQEESSKIIENLKKLIDDINASIVEEKAKDEVIKVIHNIINKINSLINKQNGYFNQIIPNEILALIFNFVVATSWLDRESSHLTCKHWNSIFHTYDIDNKFLAFISNNPSQAEKIKKQIALCDDPSPWQKTENGRVFYNKLFPDKDSKTGVSTAMYNISNRLQLDVRIIQYDKNYFDFIKNANLVLLFVEQGSMALSISSKITEIKNKAPNAKILLCFPKNIQNEKAEELKNKAKQCEIGYFEFSSDTPDELKLKIIETVYKTEIEEYKHVGQLELVTKSNKR